VAVVVGRREDVAVEEQALVVELHGARRRLRVELAVAELDDLVPRTRRPVGECAAAAAARRARRALGESAAPAPRCSPVSVVWTSSFWALRARKSTPSGVVPADASATTHASAAKAARLSIVVHHSYETPPLCRGS
jgi:hypothetical protein